MEIRKKCKKKEKKNEEEEIEKEIKKDNGWELDVCYSMEDKEKSNFKGYTKKKRKGS